MSDARERVVGRIKSRSQLDTCVESQGWYRMNRVVVSIIAAAIALLPTNLARPIDVSAQVPAGGCGIRGDGPNSRPSAALLDGGVEMHVYTFDFTAPCLSVDVLASYNVSTGRAAEGLDHPGGSGAATGVWTCS